MQKYTDAVWKWQEKDSKITKNKKAVSGLKLALGSKRNKIDGAEN